MVDYGTVAIATITALAGWGGGVITGGFRMQELSKTHVRDDAVLVRAKVEELFCELDAIQSVASQQIVIAMRVLDRGKATGVTIEKFNLGKVRSLVSLYFPDLSATLSEYDKKCEELVLTLRADLQNEDMNKMTAMYGHVIMAGQVTSNLIEKLRVLLADQAHKIGGPIRSAS